MHIALLTQFRANKNEPLAVLLERIHQAFLAAGLGQPAVQFSFSDAPVAGTLSSVERILKRFPELERFDTSAAALLGGPPVRQITNSPASPAHGESVRFATLLAIAGGVPRSFPLHSFAVHFRSPVFGESLTSTGASPGLTVTDSWWVNGRHRGVAALTVVDADPAAKKLPTPTGPLAIVLEACGKAGKTLQIPLVASPAVQAPGASAGPSKEAREAVAASVRDYRARLSEIIERAALPHDLPPNQEAWLATPLADRPGPKKPALERAFKPMGYECRGSSGMFTLRRRRPNNLAAEISLDVGTWSNSFIGFFKVAGVGLLARLPLPVSKRATANGQYPIGNAERWQQIVDNVAALVAEYDRSFVPAMDEAAGAAPEWFRPES